MKSLLVWRLQTIQNEGNIKRSGGRKIESSAREFLTPQEKHSLSHTRQSQRTFFEFQSSFAHSMGQERRGRQEIKSVTMLFNESNQSDDKRGNAEERQSHFTHHHYDLWFGVFAAVISTECQSIKTPRSCSSTICNRSSSVRERCQTTA
jgi:hypothetical protein